MRRQQQQGLRGELCIKCCRFFDQCACLEDVDVLALHDGHCKFVCGHVWSTPRPIHGEEAQARERDFVDVEVHVGDKLIRLGVSSFQQQSKCTTTSSPTFNTVASVSAPRPPFLHTFETHPLGGCIQAGRHIHTVLLPKRLLTVQSIHTATAGIHHGRARLPLLDHLRDSVETPYVRAALPRHTSSRVTWPPKLACT